MNKETTLPDKPSGRSPLAATPAPYWTLGKWFRFLSFFLLCWIGLYLITHYSKVHEGYMNLRLNAQQLDQVNKILYTNDEVSTATNTIRVDSVITDTSRKDGLIKTSVRTVAAPEYIYNKCNDSTKVNKAMLFIRSEFDNNIKEEQLEIIKQYISSFGAQEVGTFLLNIKLKIKSYFWLTGPCVYLEIVFWSIIGVICSMLFTAGIISKSAVDTKSHFNANEIPYQIAKLFYAPFCTIIIVLAYNYIKHRNVIEVNTNEGMLVFSFIAGLFAGRLMNVLERIKDILMPENVFNEAEASLSFSAAVKAAPKRQETEGPQRISNNVPDVADVYSTTVGEVGIELKLDLSGMFDEEKNEILEEGFDRAVVTLHSVNGREIITARKTGDNQVPTFLATNIEPGIYIVRCTLTQTLRDDYIINLFGEKTAYITRDNKHIDLYIKKYEAID
jgi:hypothetical protein